MSMLRIGALILAAGGSSRMGTPKPLLHFRDDNFINTLVHTASLVELNPIIVVTGFMSEIVAASITPVDGLIVVQNENWQEGQGSSIATGTRAIPDDIDAMIIMLVDQPGITTGLLSVLITTYQDSQKPIVITRVGELLTPPTLMDKVCFPALLNLKGDEGARKLLSLFDYQECNWQEDNSLKDVDTPDEYQALIQD